MTEAPDAMRAAYVAAPDRYDAMPYRRVGTSGLRLPAISLGLWPNFGDDRALATQRAIVARVRPRYHPLRPCQQLRSALRRRRGELRSDPRLGPARLPRRVDHLHQSRLRHVARAPRLGARGHSD